MDIEFLVYGLVSSYLKINTVRRRKQDSSQHYFWCLNINNPRCWAAWAHTYILGSIQSPHSQDAKWLKNHLSCLAEKPCHVHKHLALNTKPPGCLYSTSKTMIWQDVEVAGPGPLGCCDFQEDVWTHMLYVQVAPW